MSSAGMSEGAEGKDVVSRVSEVWSMGPFGGGLDVGGAAGVSLSLTRRLYAPRQAHVWSGAEQHTSEPADRP